jgi:hypothetical protein
VKRSIPIIDTTTIRCTPARSPASCRFWAADVKNSVAAFCSGEGPLDTSMTDSTPSRADARPSPMITSTPLERDIATTSCPSTLSTSTIRRPTLPVAPATAILLCVCMITLLQRGLRCMCSSHRTGFVRHYYDGTQRGNVTDGRTPMAGHQVHARLPTLLRLLLHRPPRADLAPGVLIRSTP